MKAIFSYVLLISSLFPVLTACSPENASALSNSVAKSYLESSRDNIIKNWQAKVASAPNCTEFKERFKSAGERYASAANAMFMNDMQAIWDATKIAGCAAPV